MLKDVSASLVSALQARIPGIHLRTLEESRATQAIVMAVAALKDAPELLVWSSASGLRRLVPDLETGNHRYETVASPCGFDEALGTQFIGTSGRVVLVMHDAWDELGRSIYQRFLREGLAHARATGKAIILVGRFWKITDELKSDIFGIDLPLPSAGELEEYIKNLAEMYKEKLGDKLKTDAAIIPDLARACCGLSLDETKNIVSLACVQYRALDERAVRLAIREKRQIVSRTGILEFEEPDRGMSDVGGLEYLKEWISQRGKLFSAKASKFGIKAPRGLLLVGVPGAGKTLAARAIAQAWGLPLVRMDVGRLFGSLLGDTETNLRSALSTVEALGNCVLFIDEVEKALGGGGGDLDGGTSKRVFGTLLTWMQDQKSGAFLVATCNDMTQLKSEFIRRFDAVYFTDLPNTKSRLEILMIHARRAGHEISMVEAAQATKGFTGSELENVVQSGLIAAFTQGDKPGVKHFMQAVKGIVPISVQMSDKIKDLQKLAVQGRVKLASPGDEQKAGGIEL